MTAEPPSANEDDPGGLMAINPELLAEMRAEPPSAGEPLNAKELATWYEANGGLAKMAEDYAREHAVSMKYESQVAALRAEVERLRDERDAAVKDEEITLESRATAFAEVERLRGECARLRQRADEAHNTRERIEAERDAARAEVAKLQAERAEIAEMLDADTPRYKGMELTAIVLEVTNEQREWAHHLSERQVAWNSEQAIALTNARADLERCRVAGQKFVDAFDSWSMVPMREARDFFAALGEGKGEA